MSNGIRATVALESQIRAEEGTQPSGGFAREAMRRQDSRGRDWRHSGRVDGSHQATGGSRDVGVLGEMGRGLAMNEKKKEKKWGGLKSTAMEMKHRRLIKDSLEEQRGLGSLSSLSHTCWCSSGPIYYRPRLHPTTTTSEIFMSASSVFYVLSARFQIFLLSPSPGTQHLGALRRQKTTILQEYCCQCLLVLQTQ